MMENLRASIAKLLVVSNVQIHWSIYEYLQPLHENQACLTSTCQ